MSNLPPRGQSTVTASVTVSDAKAAIEFYKRAFNATVELIMDGFMGKVGHSEVRIGNSLIFVNDEFPGAQSKSPKALGGTTYALQLYVDDCDAWYSRAVAQGAKSTMAPADMFWGDRMSQVIDPFGVVWGISTQKEHVSPEELKRRQDEFMKQMAAGHK